MRVSLITTVKNEESSIAGLLMSIRAQTRLPDEIVLADGGSTDRTLAIVSDFVAQGMPIRVLVEPGANISEGRNLAIREAKGEIIACTDAGVRLSETWLADLARPIEAGEADVACGFFVSDHRTAFEVAMGATVLPSLDNIDPDRFLPSSRSVAYTKTAWEQVGGYPEWLDYCEDVVFDLELRRAGLRFVLRPSAIAYFRPRPSLSAFFKQYYRYARGDGKAGLWPKRHLIRYSTYAVAPLAFAVGFWYKLAWPVLALAVAAYLHRPLRRLAPGLGTLSAREKVQAVLWVPAIRLVGDVAKMLGYPAGLWWRWRQGHSRG